MYELKGKSILVTGSCGTVGSELVRQLLEGHYEPARVIGIDNDETSLFFQDQRWLRDKRVHFFLADIRDRSALLSIVKNVDVIFHTAALKHVVMCERTPMEAVQTNIQGVENIIHAALENQIDRVVFTSSDKAVNPTNVMGTSKLMGERLITAANSHRSSDNDPLFASTRFGNVLGSSGSVIPIFRKQIANGGPVTLTHREMSRFIMSTEQAVRLVIDSCQIAQGGEVFVTKMPVVRIEDLAQCMISELAPKYGHHPQDIEIEIIGVKPGEKLYEELMSDEETRRAIELQRYFSITPAFIGLYRHIEYDYPDIVSASVKKPYNSNHEEPMEAETLRHFLYENNLLDEPDQKVDTATQRYWPGDKEQEST